jgi:uncharacterized protein (TIGR00251 family)
MPESQVAISMGATGALLPVRVKPRGRSNVIEGVRNGRLLVSVTAPPAEGAANAAVIEVVAAALDCPRNQVQILRGQKSREKVLCINNLTPSDIYDRLMLILT